MIKKKNTQKNTQKGFTLIEMLVAVFIFSTSLVGLMFISARGLQVARDSQNQLVADYLALEAVEVVRNVRDEAFLKKHLSGAPATPAPAVTWPEVFESSTHGVLPSGCVSGSSYCSVYYDNAQPVLQPCNNCKVYYNAAGKRYFQPQNGVNTSSLVPSAFERRVQVKVIDATQIVVDVIVSWDGGVVENKENLFIWF